MNLSTDRRTFNELGQFCSTGDLYSRTDKHINSSRYVHIYTKKTCKSENRTQT